MIWTSEKPTAPGWYWVKDSETPDGPIDRPIVVEIINRQDGNLGFYLDLDAYAVHEAGNNAKWAGPLPLPEDAEPLVKPRDRRNWRIVSGEHGENEVECCEGGHDRSAACEWQPVPGARWIPLDLTQPRLEENERTIYHQEYGLAGWVVLPDKQ